jgi:hypothetical protein
MIYQSGRIVGDPPSLLTCASLLTRLRDKSHEVDEIMVDW